VKTPKQLVEVRSKIQAMKEISVGWLEANSFSFGANTVAHRPNLYVFPASMPPLAPQILYKEIQVRPGRKQRFTMIGEWQGDHPVSRQPASDMTEYETVFQLSIRRTRCENNRPVSIGSLESLQPADRVEDGRLRIPFHNLPPARILNWIEFMKSHGGSWISSTWCVHLLVEKSDRPTLLNG
jgi:hypothetical protein